MYLDRPLEGMQWAQSQVSLRSFTWLSLIYFLKYKLAQNHSMTYPNLPEFGFSTTALGCCKISGNFCEQETRVQTYIASLQIDLESPCWSDFDAH